MKKRIILLLVLSFIVSEIYGQKKNYNIMFYNVENFFDTIDDPDIRDEEFTPEGKSNWIPEKYNKKLANVERVLFDVGKRGKSFPTVIGLSEVEVRSVLEDIASTPKLRPANYRIVHYDSPEERGVDVAFLYRPDQFKLEGSKAIRSKIKSIPDFRTRDILTMWGTIEEEPFFFAVVHWSSRWGGQKQSEFLRIDNADQLRSVADSVYKLNPKTKIVFMGDFNDDPVDKSMIEHLRAEGNIDDLEKGDLFNPYYKMLKLGYGTLAYRGNWNIFDNIIVSENLVNAKRGELELKKSPTNKRVYGNIFKENYLITQSGQYKGTPFRAFSSGKFQNGYSDHLPVYIFIGK